MSDLFQLVIVGFIALGITYSVWRGGQANPESTGKLSTKVTSLDSRVKHVEAQLKGLKDESASREDITRLEGQLATLRAEMQGGRDLAARTHASVERIERLLIEKGLGAGAGK